MALTLEALVRMVTANASKVQLRFCEPASFCETRFFLRNLEGAVKWRAAGDNIYRDQKAVAGSLHDCGAIDPKPEPGMYSVRYYKDANQSFPVFKGVSKKRNVALEDAMPNCE